MQVGKKFILQVEMAKDVFQHLELVDNIHFLTLTYGNCKTIQVENAQNID
jgi:cold shock CspA family protein